MITKTIILDSRYSLNVRNMCLNYYREPKQNRLASCTYIYDHIITSAGYMFNLKCLMHMIKNPKEGHIYRYAGNNICSEIFLSQQCISVPIMIYEDGEIAHTLTGYKQIAKDIIMIGCGHKVSLSYLKYFRHYISSLDVKTYKHIKKEFKTNRKPIMSISKANPFTVV